MSPQYRASEELGRGMRTLIRAALATGVVLAVLSVIGAFFSPGDFYRSYLMGYLFWIDITLGCLATLMTQYLTGGAWGVVTRRILEAATRTLPLLAVLFIPIAIGIPHLYDWAHPDLVSQDHALRHRSSYMNPTFFVVRAVIYFGIWILLSSLLNRWSVEEDEHGSRDSRLGALSAPGLILYVFTVTFASVDWAESLTTHWYSTMWGFLFVAMQGLAAMAFSIVALAALSRSSPLREAVKPAHFHDLGKLLLMFVMLWAYFSYAQLLIVWAGNLSDEITWYLRRLHTSWGWLGGMLIVLQFIIPFLLLLSRPFKRSPALLSGVVSLILFMQIVELMWIVMPSYYRSGFHLSWLNFAVPLALGGFWLAAFLSFLSRRPLLPLQTPTLEKALIHAGE